MRLMNGDFSGAWLGVMRLMVLDVTGGWVAGAVEIGQAGKKAVLRRRFFLFCGFGSLRRAGFGWHLWVIQQKPPSVSEPSQLALNFRSNGRYNSSATTEVTLFVTG